MKDDILLVDDDPGTIQLLSRILAGYGTLRFATSGEDAIRLAREAAPDLMLLDAEMPGMSGFQVLEALKAEPALTDCAVIFVTCHSEESFEVAGFELGAADFIAKPVIPALVRARVKTQLRIKHMADELRQLATVDALTGIANRGRFNEALERECRRARRSGEPLSLLMIDVDNFKPFNDRYGHPTGDACLRVVAQALARACLRPADLVARYGGEEFVLMLPQTSRAGAQYMAHRVLDAIEGLGIPHASSSIASHVTVSVGVACYDAESEAWVAPSFNSRFMDDTITRGLPDELVQAADHALYSAKRAGRGQARWLDVADVESPERARELRPSTRAALQGAL
jgi:diguanylate cyclase (GGDEF)-like protein